MVRSGLVGFGGVVGALEEICAGSDSGTAGATSRVRSIVAKGEEVALK
jgi:hypothetical protein